MEGSSSSSNNHQEFEEHEMTSDSIFGFPNTPDKRPRGSDFSEWRSPMSMSFTPNLKSSDLMAPSPFPVITENIFNLHSNFASPSLSYGMGNSE